MRLLCRQRPLPSLLLRRPHFQLLRLSLRLRPHSRLSSGALADAEEISLGHLRKQPGTPDQSSFFSINPDVDNAADADVDNADADVDNMMIRSSDLLGLVLWNDSPTGRSRCKDMSSRYASTHEVTLMVRLNSMLRRRYTAM